METEQLSIATPSFTVGSPGSVTIVVKNTGTAAVTISSMSINGVSAAYNYTTSTAVPIAANGQVTFTITPAASTPIVAGNNYQITVTTSKGNPFSISAIPPV